MTLDLYDIVVYLQLGWHFNLFDDVVEQVVLEADLAILDDHDAFLE